jgi:hypothetical protein
LSASARGRRQIPGAAHDSVGLVLWAKRCLSAGWWPLPGQTLRRRPTVERGSEALVYVGDPLQQVIARVVIDDGPELRTVSDVVQPGYALLDVDVLLPAAPGKLLDTFPPRAGATRLDPDTYRRVLQFVRGSRPWRPEELEIVPDHYRVHRTFAIGQDFFIQVDDVPWPTVDARGRLRFDPWGHLGEGHASEVADFDVQREIQVFAVDASGETIADVTDEVLQAALVAYEAAEGGVLENPDIDQLGLWDASE